MAGWNMPRRLSGRCLGALAAGLIVLAAAAALAGDFESGYAAYQKGDFARALSLWRPLAEQGHALAEYNLGLMYAEGRGVAEDQAEAKRWFAKAGAQGVVEAQFNLAGLYLAGAEPDYAAARTWLRRAADTGLDRAQHTLAKLYQYGLGGPADQERAFHYFSLAAAQGHLGAMYNLGKAVRDGRGTEKDEAKSIAWFRRAAEGGYAKAQAKLGSRYAKGRGVPQDDLEAYVWTALAARQDLPSAVAELKSLGERLNEAQRREAERRIAAFRAKVGKR